MSFKICAFADEADNSLQGQITALKENGISLLELRSVNSKNVFDLSVSEIREINFRLNDAGIKIWSLGSPAGKIGITDSFNEHLDKFKNLLDLAAATETENIRIFSFFIKPGVDAKLHRDEVFCRLQHFVEAAKGYNVTLCHENEKDIYGDILDRCLDIHKNFPSVKAVFDPANFMQCGQNTLFAFNSLMPYIKYMHIKDIDKNGTFVPAAKGIGKIPELLNMYKSIGSVITIEPHLKVFDSLKSLELDGTSTASIKDIYRTNREAFDVAANALKEII